MNTGTDSGEIRRNIKGFMKRRETTLITILIIMCFLISLLSPAFLTSMNLLNVMRQICMIVILAMGQTLALSSGAIDLSMGATVGLSGVVMAYTYQITSNAFISLLIALLSGCLVGLINGVLVAKFRIVPFIATLGMLSIVKGAVVTATDANFITFKNDFLSSIGQGYVGKIPVPVIIMTIIVIIFEIVYSKTVFGSRIKAIGGNEEAARISGIRIDRYKILVFIISGLTASIAGIIMASRIGIGQPEAGLGWELDAIAASVVGGTSMSGGEGSIIGALIGAAIIGFISNGMTLLGISSFIQPVITGLLLISVVGIDMWKSRK